MTPSARPRRSVWADDGSAAAILSELKHLGLSQVCVVPSAPLQHLPYDVALEQGLPAEVKGRLGFAVQKLQELAEFANRWGAGGCAA